MKDLRCAVVQVCAGLDKAGNVARAFELAGRAADDGAELICLPEMFACYGPFESMLEQAESVPGPTSEMLSEFAGKRSCWLVAGSLFERTPEGRVYNCCLVLSDSGEIVATYRKIHLFDVDIPGGVHYAESEHVTPGDSVVTVDSPWARLGVSICYDVRFPELYRRLADAGAEVVLVPAAFAYQTGSQHLDVLVRCRAIENQVFVIAANQCAEHPGGLKSYGHSRIVDPWGKALASLEDDEGYCVAELSAQRLAQVRSQLPALRHRRLGKS